MVAEAVLFAGSAGMRRSSSSRCLSGILSPLSATAAGLSATNHSLFLREGGSNVGGPIPEDGSFV